jgi:hypothetical protein
LFACSETDYLHCALQVSSSGFGATHQGLLEVADVVDASHVETPAPAGVCIGVGTL